ncbi:hypothetical protein HGH93_23670 [Chitinophaga polysaccharea]|uniref:hypothetical protein n=1 Tax=Chitinophaga TaxID=79328 RepID=UPI0014555215|nr:MULTISPECIES: hypothetical protein [Chitinophaga]NLR61120.1 hypothetical protein [Chitinophaga polysaccharea]NLU94958.1 hypothetical protein [Chitinophaga sp. Ak27]
MKYFLWYCFLLLPFISYGQELTSYRDTVHNFSVGIPAGWEVMQAPKSSPVKLLAGRISADSTHRMPEKFNVTIIDAPRSNLYAEVKKLLNYTRHNPYFKLVDSSTIVNKGKRLFRMDEIHQEPNIPDTFFASIFVSYTNNKVYLLTASTLLPFSAGFRPLFHQVGASFKTGKASRKERLKIAFPATEKWKTIVDTDVDNLATRQLLPENETPDNWTQLLNEMTMEQGQVANIDQAIKSFTGAALQQSPNATVTLLAKENLPKRRWALFKVESPVSAVQTPQSQLYYVMQGPEAFHVVFIARKESYLLPSFIKTWGDIFRKSQVVYE